MSLFDSMYLSKASKIMLATSTEATEANTPQEFFQEIWDKIVLFFKQDASGLVLKIILAIIFVVIVKYGIKFSNWLIYRSLSRVRKNKKNGLKLEPMDISIIYFIQGVVKFVVWTIVIFVVMAMFGADFSSLGTILAGAVAGITLSLQSLVSNFAYGVVIISTKMVRTGDYIYGNGFEGEIKAINMLYTTLQTVDGMKVIVPNNILATIPLKDESAVAIRNLRVNFRVTSSADVSLLRSQLVEEAKKDPRVIKDKPVVLYVTDLNETSFGLSLRVNVKNDDYWYTLFALNELVVKTLAKDGYPFSSTSLSVKSNDSVSGKALTFAKNPKLPSSDEKE